MGTSVGHWSLSALVPLWILKTVNLSSQHFGPLSGGFVQSKNPTQKWLHAVYALSFLSLKLLTPRSVFNSLWNHWQRIDVVCNRCGIFIVFSCLHKKIRATNYELCGFFRHLLSLVSQNRKYRVYRLPVMGLKRSVIARYFRRTSTLARKFKGMVMLIFQKYEQMLKVDNAWARAARRSWNSCPCALVSHRTERTPHNSTEYSGSKRLSLQIQGGQLKYPINISVSDCF